MVYWRSITNSTLGVERTWNCVLSTLMMFTIHTRQCRDYLSSSVQACSSDPARIRLRSATSINYSVPRIQERNLVTEPSLWPGQPYGTVFLQQFVKQTLLARSSANSKLTFFYVLRRCLILTFVMLSGSGLE